METNEARLKRMSMRSWRRGTKEMDLILGPYADAHLVGMSAGDLLVYDRLLEESDTDLLPMILHQGRGGADGLGAVPEYLTTMIAQIGAFARARLRQG